MMFTWRDMKFDIVVKLKPIMMEKGVKMDTETGYFPTSDDRPRARS